MAPFSEILEGCGKPFVLFYFLALNVEIAPTPPTRQNFPGVGGVGGIWTLLALGRVGAVW
jgi:hypothetical protein